MSQTYECSRCRSVHRLDSELGQDHLPEALPEKDLSRLPYITEGTQDEFICFPMDPRFETDVFIQGFNIVPGNDLVAHHALVFTDPDGKSLAQAGEKGWYPCFGDANVGATQLIAAWAPGVLPNELPDNAGIPVSAGTILVMQMHYHPTGTSAEADQTGVQLKFTTEEPEWYSLVALIGNFTELDDEGFGLQPSAGDTGDGVQFRVPAGTPGHREEMTFQSPAALFGAPNAEHHILGAAPHMHYLGRHMEAWVERRDPTAPFCPAEEVGPLVACLTTQCSGAQDLAQCSYDECAEPIAALSGLCEGCLLGNLAVEDDPLKVFGACAASPKFETQEQPENECFFSSPRYDFNWQRIYEYDAPIDDLPVVRPGDVLRFECVYDNSLGNAAVADALTYQGLDSPIDVQLGSTTLDEMCLLVLQTLYKPYRAN